MVDQVQRTKNTHGMVDPFLFFNIKEILAGGSVENLIGANKRGKNKEKKTKRKEKER